MLDGCQMPYVMPMGLDDDDRGFWLFFCVLGSLFHVHANPVLHGY